MRGNVKKQWPVKKIVEKNRLWISNFFINLQRALLACAGRPGQRYCGPQTLATTGYLLIEATSLRRSRAPRKFYSPFDMNKGKGLLAR